MQRPRFRYTLAQLTKWIAVLAMFFALLRTPAWPLITAALLVVPGYAIDRARGGAGILGAMLAGAIEFLALGLIGLLMAHFSGGLGPGPVAFDLSAIVVGAILLSTLGLAWGVCVGTWLWMLSFLRGLGIAAEPPRAEPIGPIAWRGFEDRGITHPRAEGHRT
jgi:hypothetical protein